MNNKTTIATVCLSLALSVFAFSGCQQTKTTGTYAKPPQPLIEQPAKAAAPAAKPKAETPPATTETAVEPKAETPPATTETAVEPAETPKENATPEAKPASAAATKKSAPAAKAPKNEDMETTIASSSGLGKKSVLPIVVKDNTQYRPIIDVGEAPVSGTGTADNEKLEKLGGCLPASLFVDPEIFNGLSEMQTIALREAIADAVKKSDSDFLLAPRWELSVSSDKKDTEVTCTVTGYPAKIVGFEKVPPVNPDVEILKKQLADQAEHFKGIIAQKDQTIQVLQNQIDTMKVGPTRAEVMKVYLDLIKEYDLKDMEAVRRILALMGENCATTENYLIEKTKAGIRIKPQDGLMKGNIEVALPVKVSNPETE